MRTVDATQVTQTVRKLCILANTHADEYIKAAITKAAALENEPLPKSVLDMLCENMVVAEKENMPICQDTGMVVVFVEIGQEVYVDGDLAKAINEGVRQGYRDGYLRASIVSDPAERVNTKDNTPAVIYFNIVSGDRLRLTVMPKGFGSENKSALKMFVPADGIGAACDFVVETVKKASGDPCPPIVVGVGIGGTMEKAAILSKEALIHVSDETDNPYWRNIECELLERINGLGIGAGGFGGRSTCLGVKVLTFPTHIAGLPVAVNIGCHVSRKKSAVL